MGFALTVEGLPSSAHCACCPPVQVAAYRGWLGVLQAVLQVCPAAVDAKGSEGTTPLHLAILQDRRECAKHLLAKGANVDSRVPQGGAAPLHYSVNRLQLEMVQLLCDSGADVNAKTHRGASPLDMLPRNIASEEEKKRAADITRNISLRGGVAFCTAVTVAVAGS